MIEEKKKRHCVRCKQEKDESEFQYTPSIFFPAHRSYICTSCLEKIIPQDNLGEVDRLCRWLDLPFDLNKWTQLYAIHGGHTLTAYFATLVDEHYQSLQWADENERWQLARKNNTIDKDIEVLSAAEWRRLKKDWSDSYSNDDLLWLDDYYNQIVATQNTSTPILQQRARDLCEITLRAKKDMRLGKDVKKDMDAISQIIKDCNFTATNAKNAADFESVGELMTYYGRLGWHPNWHTEPQDSIDFLMQNMQNYIKRLVINEGNFSEQVENARERYNMTERLEEIENEALDLDETAGVEYEGEEEFSEDLNE